MFLIDDSLIVISIKSVVETLVVTHSFCIIKPTVANSFNWNLKIVNVDMNVVGKENQIISVIEILVVKIEFPIAPLMTMVRADLDSETTITEF